MKRVIAVVVLVGVALAAVGAWVGVRRLHGVVTQQLSAALQTPVTIRAVEWAPIFGVQIRDLVVPGPMTIRGASPWLRVAGIRVQVVPWAWLWRRTVVMDVRVTRPELVVVRRADGRMALPSVKAPAAGGAGPGGGAETPSVIPRSLHVRDGLITYRDEAIAPGGVTVQLAQLDADLHPVFPSTALRGRVSGVFRAPDGQAVGHVKGEGTFRLDRTGQGTVTLTHQAIQQLAPYVQSAIGAAPTAGTLTVRADVTAQGEQVTIPVHLEAQGLTFAPEAMTVVGVPAQQMVQLLQDGAGRITFDVTVQGRWDQLQVSWQSVITSALQQALRSAMARQVQRAVEQLVTPPADGGESGSLEDRLKQLGRDLKRSLKDAVAPPADSSGTTQ